MYRYKNMSIVPIMDNLGDVYFMVDDNYVYKGPNGRDITYLGNLRETSDVNAPFQIGYSLNYYIVVKKEEKSDLSTVVTCLLTCIKYKYSPSLKCYCLVDKKID